MIGIRSIPIQWLLRTPHCTGIRPMLVATKRMRRPMIPVKRNTSITMRHIVPPTKG